MKLIPSPLGLPSQLQGENVDDRKVTARDEPLPLYYTVACCLMTLVGGDSRHDEWLLMFHR